MNVKYMQRYQHINIFASISGPEVSDVIMFYAYFTITESLKWIENQAGEKMLPSYCLASITINYVWKRWALKDDE